MNVQSIKNLEDMKNCLESGEVDTFSKAIRLKCLDCCAYNHSEVKRCEVTMCPLWPFRTGHRVKKQEITL